MSKHTSNHRKRERSGEESSIIQDYSTTKRGKNHQL